METYLYGQGKVKLALRTGDELGPWIWIGDVSELTGTLAEETFDHQESYSGEKGRTRKINLGKTMNWSATLHELSTANLARFTNGTNTVTESGTVTSESLGTVAAGDAFQLDHFNVSNLVITDSAGSPATIAASHYEYDVYGNLEFITLPTSPAPTMPLLAAYSYGAYNAVAFLNATRGEFALRYEGVNLAEGNAPILMELYKVSPGLLQTLGMITNGNQLAAAPVTFDALLDTSKVRAGALGQYGRIVTMGY
jgi:hypothetical protein